MNSISWNELTSAIATARKLCSPTAFSQADELQLTVFGHLVSIISISESIDLLARNGRRFDILILLRSLLEHHLSLRQLSKNKTHLKSLQHNAYKDENQLISAIKKGNPYTASLDKFVDVEKSEAKIKKLRSDLNKWKSKPLEQRIRDEDGGEDVYIVYRDFSRYVHPNLKGMNLRLVEWKKSFEEGYPKQYSEELEAKLVFSTTRNIILDATELVKILTRAI